MWLGRFQGIEVITTTHLISLSGGLVWLGRFQGIEVITTTHPHLSLWRLGVAWQVPGDRGDYYNTPSSLSLAAWCGLAGSWG